MRKLIISLACFFGFASSASAVVVEFEPPGAGSTITSLTSDGMLFNGSFVHQDGSVNPLVFPDNGGGYVQLLFSSSLSFGLDGGGAFSLGTVDLSEYSTVVGGPATIVFEGTRSNGSTVQNTFVTDGIIDANGPLNEFETFTFSGFNNLVSVAVLGTPVFSMDNLAYNEVTVPEPPVALLLLAGVVGMVVRRR